MYKDDTTNFNDTHHVEDAMIDINELRRLAQAALAGPDGASLSWIKFLQDFQQKAGPTTILELLDRLEAVEKERDALRALVVMRFDHDRPPQFTQGYDTHELTEPVTAEHCRWFVDEIERLRAEVAHIKEVEFPRKAQAVADGWRGRCERLEAKIEQMEKQAPAYWGPKHAIEGGSTTVIVGKFPVNPTDAPLYALPGAKENDGVATD